MGVKEEEVGYTPNPRSILLHRYGTGPGHFRTASSLVIPAQAGIQDVTPGTHLRRTAHREFDRPRWL
jgi:hypothetical protein